MATYGRGVWESDLQTVVIPCNAPSGLSTTSITINSATLNWNPVAGAVSYDVDYKLSSAPTWTILYSGTTATSVNLPGLSSGILWFHAIGGWDPQVLIGQSVQVWTRTGPVAGVIARKPIHLQSPDDRKVVPEIKNLWVDIAASELLR